MFCGVNSREGHVETTRLLLNKGAEINTPSGSNDDTPLTLACWKGTFRSDNLCILPLLSGIKFAQGGKNSVKQSG